MMGLFISVTKCTNTQHFLTEALSRQHDTTVRIRVLFRVVECLKQQLYTMNVWKHEDISAFNAKKAACQSHHRSLLQFMTFTDDNYWPLK